MTADEQGGCDVAVECLRKAVQVAPGYSDATFNLALLLQRRKSVRRGGSLSAALSRYRQPIGMG
jgi:hypothetical protein